MGACLCCMEYCCPPFPSRIASKVAFFPPNPPSYEIVDGLVLLKELKHETLPEYVSLVTLKTKRKQTINGFHIKTDNPGCTLLFSHGNAVDIGQMLPHVAQLCFESKCNAFIYDYSGYGASTGIPLEKNVESDVEAAYDYLTQDCKISPKDIIVYGQSIGSGPSVYISRKISKQFPDEEDSFGGLILHSPLKSGIRVLKPSLETTMCCDIFPNIDRIQHINAPILIMHGLSDEVIHISHGRDLHEKAVKTVEPLWIPNAGHNDLEIHTEYWDRVKTFIQTRK